MSDEKQAMPGAARTGMKCEMPPPCMPPIPPGSMTAEQSAAVAEMIAGERGQLMRSYVPILRSPALMRKMQAVGEFFRFECSLDPRLKEMASLMVARQWGQHVWEAHTRAGAKCGLNMAIMRALGEGRPPDRMS